MRRLQTVINNGLPILGVLVILGAEVVIQDLRLQLAVVVFGILLIEAGVWRLAYHFVPEARHYNALRAEGDYFMGLIRKLNRAAIAVKKDDSTENRQAVTDIRQEMLQVVEQMVAVAGKTDDELTAEYQQQTPALEAELEEPSNVG